MSVALTSTAAPTSVGLAATYLSVGSHRFPGKCASVSRVSLEWQNPGFMEEMTMPFGAGAAEVLGTAEVLVGPEPAGMGRRLASSRVNAITKTG